MSEKINYYRIADLNVRIKGDEKYVAAIHCIEGFDVFEYDAQPSCDIEIVICDKIELKGDTTTVNSFEHEGIRHSFSVNSDELLFQLDKDDESLLVHNLRHTNQVKMTTSEDLSMVRFALWVAYSMVSVEKGVVPIHSSVVSHGGYAVLSLGESGTGKSTHSRMWQENIEDCYLLNDDSPILKMCGEELFAYGSPWSGKLNCYKAESYPVKSINRVIRASENRMERLNPIHAIAAVYPSLPPMFAYDKNLSSKMLSMVSSIIKSTPIYNVHCRPDAEAAIVSHKELFLEHK